MDRLFIYGSLQPGGPNEHVMTAIGGEWEPAAIRGRLVASGWGAKIGFPGLVVDAHGEKISGYVFTSQNLEAHWSELDAFEGNEYRRINTDVMLVDGTVIDAYVYVLRSKT